MDDKVLSFNARISNYERLNEQFMKVKINVCHKGKNANYTDFTDEAMNELASTILGVPVVGEFDVDKRQFKGHGGKLIIEDDKVEWVRTTQPYGFVPLDQTPFYETVLEPDGLTQNEYLTVYAILWTELYPELFEAFDKKVHQSMEINVKSSEWDENGEYCVIKKASMMALCLLQTVKPCFKGSVVTNQFSEVDFDSKYQALVDSYQQYALAMDGGEKMENIEVLEIETTNPVEEETIEAVSTTEDSMEETKSEINEPQEEALEEAIPTEEVVEFKEDSSDMPLEEEVEEKEEDKTEEETEKEPLEEKEEELKEDYQAKYDDLTQIHEALKADFEALTSNFNDLTQDYEALKLFKEEVLAERRQLAEDALFERFEELADFEGFDELKAQAKQFSLEELEVQLFALMGRRTYSLKQPTPARTKPVVYEGNSLKSNTPNVFGMLDEFINIK